MTVTMPGGWLEPLVGGILIGLSAGGLRLFSGRIAGISGIMRLGIAGLERGWRLAFLAGLLLAGLGATFWRDAAQLTSGLEGTSLPILALAGLLVGIGTGLGNGCTSGHGICGLARFSKRSLVAVLVFMATAALVVFVVRHGGGQ